MNVARERLGFGERVRLFTQSNENRGIIMRADARVSERDRRLDARARAMRRHNRRYRLARHAPCLPLAVAGTIVARTAPRLTLPLVGTVGRRCAASPRHGGVPATAA